MEEENYGRSHQVADFIKWLRRSGCRLYRIGNYDLTVDELHSAYIAYCTTGTEVQLKFLDALRLDAIDDEILSLDEVAIYERIAEGEAIWCETLPPEMAKLLKRSHAFYEHRRTYEFRRGEANRAITDRELRKRIFERDGYVCRLCKATEDLSIDHVKAVLNGGDDSEENLQLLCRPCNSRKGAK